MCPEQKFVGIWKKMGFYVRGWSMMYKGGKFSFSLIKEKWSKEKISKKGDAKFRLLTYSTPEKPLVF